MTLEPCPFCGSTDIREDIEDGGGMGDFYAIYYICWGCGATSGMEWNILDDKDRSKNKENKSIIKDEADVRRDAMKLWNTRNEDICEKKCDDCLLNKWNDY